MKSFRINEVERYSQVKAHTLRIWEQRYGFPKPSRDLVQCRTYSLKEFTQILDLSVLNRNGFRISFLQTLTPTEIQQKLQQLHSSEDQKWMVFRRLLVHMFSLDIHEFEEELDRCFLRWPS